MIDKHDAAIFRSEHGAPCAGLAQAHVSARGLCACVCVCYTAAAPQGMRSRHPARLPPRAPAAAGVLQPKPGASDVGTLHFGCSPPAGADVLSLLMYTVDTVLTCVRFAA
ncbi:hypothetical protein HPB50_018889 [Hyalomma asiaticum]|uniref:Uncharacterized protein n=1 Tax=Hyalomma asiaticum TaxID=266040 RepID=A0ACB7TIP3_HYAAI|nr:hypothetical protein HPB50_018889 [Hyalomma asiaticum]